MTTGSQRRQPDEIDDLRFVIQERAALAGAMERAEGVGLRERGDARRARRGDAGKDGAKEAVVCGFAQELFLFGTGCQAGVVKLEYVRHVRAFHIG